MAAPNGLLPAGFAVVGVADGVEALRLIEEQVPKVVVLDLLLPRLSGLDVHKELKTSLKDAEHSDRRPHGHRHQKSQFGRFECVLRKPINMDVLIRAVVSCLRRHPVDACLVPPVD
jgi:chemosensory pili system protein ChpA (sensor histidine kinase/response regulator)